jgi:transcriptional regulator with GAF, ATPase, and Fis domain
MKDDIPMLTDFSGSRFPALSMGVDESFVDDVLESLKMDVAVLDRRGKILRASKSLIGLGGPMATDLAGMAVGLHYRQVIGPAQAEGDPVASWVVDAVEAILRGTGAETSLDYSREDSDSLQWFQVKVTPLKPRGTGVAIATTAINELNATREALKVALRDVEALRSRVHESEAHIPERVSEAGIDRMVGQSTAIRDALSQVDHVAATDSTVLLMGETGTGKELLAARIHKLSPRRSLGLVSVNCAALPAPLVESELFGREKGAFTGSLSRQIGRFELANGSTIFLDEIGELSPEVQAKLLRVLEARQVERLGSPKPVTVDVRVIAATNRDLEIAVREGTFRQDLFYRLNVFPIRVPPLRERREDIPVLVWAFVDEFAKLFNKNIQSIEKESLEALQHYAWPGNVRELRNLVERAMIIANGPRLRIQLPAAGAVVSSSTSRRLEEVERQHILAVLEKSGWRIRGAHGAAEQLGLKPTTLEARMARLGIRRPSGKDV